MATRPDACDPVCVDRHAHVSVIGYVERGNRRFLMTQHTQLRGRPRIPDPRCSVLAIREDSSSAPAEHGAPHVAIVHTDEALGVYGAIDCGGYVTSFMLAAQALGVATVPQAALAFHSEVVRRHFGLGDDRRVVCGISFGYPDRDHRINSYRTSRASVTEAATFVD